MPISPYAGLLANYLLGGAQGPIPLDPGNVPPAIASMAAQGTGVVAPPAPVPAFGGAHLPGIGVGAAAPGSPMADPRLQLTPIPQPAASAPATGGGPSPAAAPSQESGNEQALARAFLSPPAGGGGTSHSQVTKTVQQGAPLSPENLAATKDAMKGVADIDAANAERAAERDSKLALHQAFQAQIAQDEQNKQDQIATGIRERQDQYRTAYDEASKQDPADVYHGNVFAGILGTLGQAAGAYGAAITHSQNWAADLIKEAVKTNVQVLAEKKRGIYQQFRDAGLDAKEAENAANAAGLQRAALEADRQASLQRSDDAKSKLTMTAARLRLDQQQIDNDNEKETKGKVTTSFSQSGSSGGGGGGDLPAFLAKRREEWVKLGRDPAVFDKAADLAPGTVPGGKGGQKIAALVAQGQNALDTTQSLQKNVGGSENDSWVGRQVNRIANSVGDVVGTKASKEREVDRTLLKGELGKLATGGVASGEEIKELSKLVESNDPATLAQVAKRIVDFRDNYKNANKMVGAPDRPDDQ